MLKRITEFLEERRRDRELLKAAHALQASEFKGQSVEYIMNLIRGGEFDANVRA